MTVPSAPRPGATDEVRVLVYDDEANSADAIKARLDELPGLTVTCLEHAEDAVEELEARRQGARTPGANGDAGSNPFDLADVLVVDYDLTVPLGDDGPRIGAAETGERIAYLVRCYSRCRFIVALNQFATEPTFDLTMLGHPSSYADLNVSGDEIDHPSLWGGTVDGYQPWWWPNLREAPGRQRDRASAVAASFEQHVLQLVGLDGNRVRNNLSRRQLAWLSSKDEPHTVTIADAMKNGKVGFKPRDKAWDEESRADVAAARIGKWLERFVLPGQDVVIDEPHLVSRFPSLLLSGAPERAILRGPNSPTLVDEHQPTLADHTTHQPPWFPRRTWLWPDMADDHRIAEVDDPFDDVADIGRFCEDVSCFLPAGQARAFSAEFAPFSRRFVASPPDGDVLRTGTWSISDVRYEPAVAFASG